MANTDTNNAAKRAVAKHALINSAGTEVEDEESAQGMTYTLLGNGATHTYQYGQHPDADRMLALFGAKTLATNETSQVRNNPKAAGKDDHDAQIQAVRDRFTRLTQGQWVDRTREPGAPQIDKQALVRAIAKYAHEQGSPLDDKRMAELTEKVEEDKAYVRKVRNFPPVAALYAQEAGKPQVTADDILSF